MYQGLDLRKLNEIPEGSLYSAEGYTAQIYFPGNIPGGGNIPDLEVNPNGHVFWLRSDPPLTRIKGKMATAARAFVKSHEPKYQLVALKDGRQIVNCDELMIVKIKGNKKVFRIKLDGPQRDFLTIGNRSKRII